MHHFKLGGMQCNKNASPTYTSTSKLGLLSIGQKCILKSLIPNFFYHYVYVLSINLPLEVLFVGVKCANELHVLTNNIPPLRVWNYLLSHSDCIHPRLIHSRVCSRDYCTLPTAPQT